MDYLFEALNPWWDNSNWNTESYERREFQDVMRLLDFEENKKPRAPILVGPRRVGKTTLMYQVIRAFLKKIPASNILYYSFERADPEMQHNQNALSEIVTLWGNREYDTKKPRLLLLDEIQNVKDWDSRMKTILEATFSAPLLVMMTGSSSFDLISKSLQTLHGVTRRIFMPPFSLVDFWLMEYPEDIDFVEKTEQWRKLWLMTTHEDAGNFMPNPMPMHIETMKDEKWKKALNLQETWLLKGGFPEFWHDVDQRVASELFDFYVRRVAQDDILKLQGISKSVEIARFLKYCYFHPGGELNITTASQELGIPRSTMDVMLDLLSNAGYLRVIPRYTGNAASLRQRHIKIYPIDHGLIPRKAPNGMTIETMVVNTFSRMEEAEIYFLRKKTGGETKEIDFAVKAGSRLIAVEVKRRIERSDVEKFRKTVSELLPQATNRIMLCWDTDENGLIQDTSINSEYVEIQPLWKIALGLPNSLLAEGESL
ncbi:ATP-binding protein [Candidatus Peregrinibacteria bacterium]|nr:ATP-binding protein [Candidatus Peregrinibacteria bacterium]